MWKGASESDLGSNLYHTHHLWYEMGMGVIKHRDKWTLVEFGRPLDEKVGQIWDQFAQFGAPSR